MILVGFAINPVFGAFLFAVIGAGVAITWFTASSATRLTPELHSPLAATLPERVAEAQATLRHTSETITATLTTTGTALTALVSALEDELRTRAIALDALAAEAEAALQRADQARSLAAIEEKSAEAIDALIDRRMKERFRDAEASGHRWDLRVMWITLTLGVPFGMVAGALLTFALGHN